MSLPIETMEIDLLCLFPPEGEALERPSGKLEIGEWREPLVVLSDNACLCVVAFA